MLQFIPLILSLPLIGFWVTMFRDLTQNDYLSKNEKTTWYAYLLVLNVFGAFWYYLVEYRHRHL